MPVAARPEETVPRAVPAGLSPRQLQQAQRCYRELGRKGQFQLAREMVETRAAELRLAYPDLAGIGFGFKTRATRTGKARELIRLPCVVFEVQRKRKLTSAAHRARMLPAHLFTYVGEDHARRLCAVPTDVKPTADFGRPVPHDAQSGAGLAYGILVWPKSGDALGAGGTITCAIERPEAPGILMGMSCRHVLSRSLLEAPDTPSGSPVETGNRAATPIGSSDATRGRFAAAPSPSFDAQLLRVDSRAALRSAMLGIRFNQAESLLLDPADIPNGFWVATPRQDVNGQRLKIWVTFTDWVQERTIPYAVPGGSLAVAHSLAILAEARDGPLMKGDSGSPAILVKGGGKLLGMYLGGDGFHCYFIPAWQLMSPWNYGASGEDWKIVNP